MKSIASSRARALAIGLLAAGLSLSAHAAHAAVALEVSADGKAAYRTIHEAIAALPPTGGVVHVHSGVYREKIRIDKPNVLLIGLGKDASKVVITNDDYAAKYNPATRRNFGTSDSYTVMVTGNDFYATNLTIANTADYEPPNYLGNGQALALYSKGDRAVFRAVRLLSGQDTLRIDGARRAYFHNSYVEGTVDYIWGDGKAVFDHCLVRTRINGRVDGTTTITAQGRERPDEDTGFVFIDSDLLFESAKMSNVFLGRPWQQYAATYFVNTTMGPQIAPAGWMEFHPGPGGSNNLPTSTYREYNSLYPAANGKWAASDLRQRESVSPQSNVSLSANEAARLVADVYLAGNDHWAPTRVNYGTKTQQKLPVPAAAP